MILSPQFWAVLKKISNNLPLEPTHKRRPAREFMGQGQNSQLQTELDLNQAAMVERKVPAYNRLKTDCVALRSVWLRTRMAGGVGAGGVNAPRYPNSAQSSHLQN